MGEELIQEQGQIRFDRGCGSGPNATQGRSQPGGGYTLKAHHLPGPGRGIGETKIGA